MATNKTSNPSPLTFDLPMSLIEKIEVHQKRLGLRFASEVVRLAIEEFDYNNFESCAEEHRQISVRLPAQQKSNLVKIARKKNTSVGELLRVAIDALEVKAPKKAPKAKK